MELNVKKTRSFENFIWIDFTNPDVEHLTEIAEVYSLDFFQIRDSIETGHLPKFERQPGYDFLILRAFTSNIDEGGTTIVGLSNKIAFFYNEHKIISVHRSPFYFLGDIRIDFKKPEELLIHLILKMADTYQTPMMELDQKIADLEKMLFLKDYTKVSLEDLYFLKTQTRITKKLLQLFQHTVNQIEVAGENKTALQDIKDRLVSLILSFDEILENAHNLLNTYHSINAKKNNDVMKLLTIFSAFFLPLTFVAGIYGMNFENMPELRWPMGYFIVLVFMVLLSLFIFIWFRRRRII